MIRFYWYFLYTEKVTPDNALAFTTHFIECIDLYREKSVIEHELKLVPNLMGYIPIMIEHGECPHKALQAIIRILDGKPDTTSQFQDYILVSTSQIMHIISTTYFKDIFAILEVTVLQSIQIHSVMAFILFSTTIVARL